PRGGAGTDAALETADLVLMGDDRTKLPYALELSRKTGRTRVANLAFALGMIVLMVASILSVGLPLPLAVVGHEGSTVVVSLNGLRLLAFRDRGRLAPEGAISGFPERPRRCSVVSVRREPRRRCPPSFSSLPPTLPVIPLRTSGLLLHVTSLPGRFGVGDLGPAAYRFVDFLARAKQGLWPVLPLVPVDAGGSPYSSPSPFAGNPLLVSPEGLAADGLLTEDDLAHAPAFPAGRVDFARVIPFREALLRRAFARFEAGAAPALREAFAGFCARHAEWLDDYALFTALK